MRDIEAEAQAWEERQRRLDALYPDRKRPPNPFFNPKRAAIRLAVIITVMAAVPWIVDGVTPFDFLLLL